MDQESLREIVEFITVSIPGLLIAITYHEIAHGFVADRLGDPTARMLGRLSANPIRHIDPVGTILVPLALAVFTAGTFVFGWAKPVPVNPINLRNPKQDMAFVAAAGPFINLLLAIGGAMLFRGLLFLFGSTAPDGFVGVGILYIAQVLNFFVFINVLLMLFNLFPIPPLDGGRILVGLLPEPLSERVAAIEPFGFFIVIGVVMLDPGGIWSKGMGAGISAITHLLLP